MLAPQSWGREKTLDLTAQVQVSAVLWRGQLDRSLLSAGQTPRSAQLPLGSVVDRYKLVANYSWSSLGAGIAHSSEGVSESQLLRCQSHP